VKKTCVIVAPCYCASGYSVHSRQIAKILNSYENLEVILRATIWGNTPFILRDMPEKIFLDEMNARCVKYSEDFVFDYSVQVILPDEFKPNIAHYNIGITAGVETTVCNPAWVEACNKMNLIIVPSEHVKKTLQASGKLTVPTYVVPETFPSYLEDENLKCDLDIDFDTSFNFLHVGQLGAMSEDCDRKGILTLVRIFCQAFEGNKDVGLVIKTNMGRNTTIDRSILMPAMHDFVKRYRKSEFPRIYIVHGPMDDIDICKLYKHNKIKAFVSLTKGEGFGLPLLEAAAAGLPILTTNWSGHLDFLNIIDRSFIKLNYELVTVPESKIDNRIFVKDAHWAKVLEQDAIRKMNKIYESYNLPKQWAQNLQKAIIPEFKFEMMQKKFKEVINIK